MFLAEYQFFPKLLDLESKNLFEEHVSNYLFALRKNGQLWETATKGWDGNSWRVFCKIPEPITLNSSYGSMFVQNAWDQLLLLCKKAPTLHVYKNSENSHSHRNLKQESSLFLFTHMFDETSPVNSGDDGCPIPLYRLPMEASFREELFVWMRGYKVIDTLWIDSGALEWSAYQQMAYPKSKLSQEGRDLAKTLEHHLQIPIYYYVFYSNFPWEKKQIEHDHRLCPLCKEPWDRQKLGTADQGLDRFALRCTPCRLVSND